MGIDECIENLRAMQKFYQMYDATEVETIEMAIKYIKAFEKVSKRIHEITLKYTGVRG